MRRSVTVGMPKNRVPTFSLEISTRRSGLGSLVPFHILSRIVCQFCTMCLRKSFTDIPSMPRLPLFASTLASADSILSRDSIERQVAYFPIPCSALPHLCDNLRTMASTDLCTFNMLYRARLRSLLRLPYRSPQVRNAIFRSIYLPHLLSYAFSSVSFDLLCSLVQRTLALYEVRVPQT